MRRNRRRQLLPTQTLHSILAEVGKVIDELRAADPELDIDWALDRHWEAASTSPENIIAQASQRAVEEATGLRLEFGASTAPSDMRWIVQGAGIPTAKVCFGSETADADERQNLDDYIRTIQGLRRTHPGPDLTAAQQRLSCANEGA